ncbi:MAG: hypothetical protein LC650_00375 [Actinobacteria bacterium]|nr:hypothetical protein [Actinomycetota bacterium]
MQVTKEELVRMVNFGGWTSIVQNSGVGEDDVPMELRAAWVEVLWAWRDFKDATRRLERQLLDSK